MVAATIAITIGVPVGFVYITYHYSASPKRVHHRRVSLLTNSFESKFWYICHPLTPALTLTLTLHPHPHPQ